MKIAVGLLFLCSVSLKARSAPVKIIFDTDMASDVDDVGALAVLHVLADGGEAEILGTAVSAVCEHSAPCVSALNRHFGRPNLPIGVVRVTEDRQEKIGHPSRYAEAIAAEFPGTVKRTEDAEDAVALYRRLLALSEEKEVVIVTVGFTSNLADLLASGPDETSPLSGRALVADTVKHWVCMGGAFPAGREFNLFSDDQASRFVLREWPTPVTFSGAEIGKKIFTGEGLTVFPESHPLRRAYILFHQGTCEDRQSWDQTAVLYAVRCLEGGCESLWELSQPGRCTLEEDGTTKWVEDPQGTHRYLIERMAPEEVAERIEALMKTPPAGRARERTTP